MRHIARTLAFVTLIASCSSAFGQDAPKRLAIINNSFDFGKAPQNAVLTHFTWFKAIGTDTVKIDRIQTGCDCTTMPLERNTIAPGDSMLVGVYWNTERKIGNSGRYPYIWVAGQPEAERILLKADVTLFPDSAQPVSAKPFRAEFSKLGTVSVDSVNITLTNRSMWPLKLAVVSPDLSQVRIRIADSLPAHGTGTLHIEVAPEYADTEFERSVTVAFNYETGTASGTDVKGRLTIPIRRKIISQPGS